jgi:hypothetical protein
MAVFKEDWKKRLKLRSAHVYGSLPTSVGTDGKLKANAVIILYINCK